MLLKFLQSPLVEIYIMEHNMPDQKPEEPDALEEVTSVIHIALPVVAAILMFMLAFIAITMA